jgi:hypothetical protein
VKWIIAIFLVPSLVTTVAAAFIIGPMLMRYRHDSHLRANGLPATATVLALQDTGSRVNMQPVAEVTLQVSPPGGAEFQSSAKVVITPVNGPFFQPGRQVQVRYDPKAPAQVVIVAAAAGAGP